MTPLPFKLRLEPFLLKMDHSVIIDTINVNELTWLLDKAKDNSTKLSAGILMYSKQQIVSEQLCEIIAESAISLALLERIFSNDFIQKLINQKLVKIHNANVRKTKNKQKNPKINKIGFNLSV